MISDITPAHHDKILKLNAAFVHWLAPLDKSELRALIKTCIYARQIGGGDAALIAIASETKTADHPNLDWLKARRENFIYIDRVIVSAAAQGQGYGGRLYADLADFARAKGYASLTCEVNTRPDNPSSHTFHLREGFISLGERDFVHQGKAVRYYAKALH